jgi:hypothetical protein
MSKEDEIPSIDLKLESKQIEGKIIHVPWIIVETPYMIFSDKNGTRKIWTKNKKKIVLWFLYKITRIKWFIKKYNEQPR